MKKILSILVIICSLVYMSFYFYSDKVEKQVQSDTKVLFIGSAIYELEQCIHTARFIDKDKKEKEERTWRANEATVAYATLPMENCPVWDKIWHNRTYSVRTSGGINIDCSKNGKCFIEGDFK